MNDPASPSYGKYLASDEFTQKYSPTTTEYNKVISFAQENGLKVTETSGNHTILDVTGPASAVESAFNIRLSNYRSRTGRLFYAPNVDPSVPSELAGVISGVIGLDDAAEVKPNFIVPQIASPSQSAQQVGTGPGNGLSPGNIQRIYDVTPNLVSSESLGLVELDGYNVSDINAYLGYYQNQPNELPTPYTPVMLQNVLVDGFSGRPTISINAEEVTLDIELQLALSPYAKKIIVYEGPTTPVGLADVCNRIAKDNQAKEISCSWAYIERQQSSSVLNSENNSFMQMAAQGQSMFVASGDRGAYGDGSTLSVEDPSSQPYVTSVGGTTLHYHYDGSVSYTESTWMGTFANIPYNGGGSGGGISSVWRLPSYQNGVVSAASLGSASMRNIPDVSLNADPNTGYSIYYGGQWTVIGGTSCAAPLWAAYVANVNANRVAGYTFLGGVKPRLGFINPVLYKIGQGAHYTTFNPSGGPDFNDIADGSNNLYYPAIVGYDLATGWGSFNGRQMYSDLESY